MSDPTDLTIAEAHESIAAKKLSPVELTAATFARIERLNPKTNAYVTLMEEGAVAAARESEARAARGELRTPLDGVPIGLKDLYETAGVRTTACSRVLLDYVPAEDSATVRLLKEAGAVLTGKLNTHEFAWGDTNVDSYFGPVHNPWDLSRVPGGSSGGSGAAVAARLCQAAMGSDTGGSIRIPSSLCGIVGHKPTFGLVSKRGVIPMADSLDHAGPMTRSVRDAAIMLNVLAGYDPRDTRSVDRPKEDYTVDLNRGIRGLRIGVPRAFFFDHLQAEVASAFETALGVLVDLGATAQDVEIPNSAGLRALWMAIGGPETTYEHVVAGWWGKRDGDYLPRTLNAIKEGSTVSAVDYLRAVAARRQLQADVAALMSHMDVLLTPTTPRTAPTIEEAGTASFESTLWWNTGPFNLTLQPTLTVPCGFDGSGLPIGLQIAGRLWEDATVLRVGSAYQAATDWHTRRPPLGSD